VATRWEHFGHDADVGVRGIGDTPEQAFEQAALALTAIVTDVQKVKPEHMIRIACDAPDTELLLADWLNALIYEMDVRKMLFGRFEVHLSGSALEARAWGEAIDAVRHQPSVEPKGATYTALAVGRAADGCWQAQCVVDI
jgi:tRNA nucleotidyltransferase (CCA-adding enzyme)